MTIQLLTWVVYRLCRYWLSQVRLSHWIIPVVWPAFFSVACCLYALSRLPLLINLSLPGHYVPVLCSLLTSWLIETKSIPGPPGVSNKTFHWLCLIYPSLFPNDFGLLDSGVNYPQRQALYQISVRHHQCLPTASFRFPITRDTLAFDYRIPVITAPWGLEVLASHLLVLLHARHTPRHIPTERGFRCPDSS